MPISRSPYSIVVSVCLLFCAPSFALGPLGCVGEVLKETKETNRATVSELSVGTVIKRDGELRHLDVRKNGKLLVLERQENETGSWVILTLTPITAEQITKAKKGLHVVGNDAKILRIEVMTALTHEFKVPARLKVAKVFGGHYTVEAR